MNSLYKVQPVLHSLNANVRVPGSKSLTNRVLLVASLANGSTCLTNALFSDDSHYFVKALQTLGFDIRLDKPANEMTVVGLGGKIPSQSANLFIGNAGTAARFLSAFLTLGHGEYVIDGDARMRERPIGDLVTAITSLGANIHPLSSHLDPARVCPPLRIVADGLPGGKTRLPGNTSSQFLSALLMVAPYARSSIDIEISTELSSRPYVDMTIAVMKDFGVEVERRGFSQFILHPTRYSSIPRYVIESDVSSASSFFAAPAVCSGTVKVENITRSSRQGDIAFLDVLQRMGCFVHESGNSIVVSSPPLFRGVEVDMRDIPDTAITLAAIAPFAISPTCIFGIASARFKETDRIHAVCTELSRLGVHVEERTDGMVIHPCQSFRPSVVQTYHDHRMAMAFSLIGLRVPGIEIEDPSCVSKTFPGFFEMFEALR